MAAWCYILRCGDGPYYTGCTTDLDARTGQHRSGLRGGYTATRLPVEPIWTGGSQTIHDAIAMERRVKRWSRAKKEALTSGDWKALQAAALSYRRHPRGDAAERRKATHVAGVEPMSIVDVVIAEEGAVTFPEALLDHLGWKEGEVIVVEGDEDGVLLRRPGPGELSEEP